MTAAECQDAIMAELRAARPVTGEQTLEIAKRVCADNTAAFNGFALWFAANQDYLLNRINAGL